MPSLPKDFTQAIKKLAYEQNRDIVSLAAISVVDNEMHIHVIEGNITDDDVYTRHYKSAAVESDYTTLVASIGLDGIVKLMEDVKGGETECN